MEKIAYDRAQVYFPECNVHPFRFKEEGEVAGNTLSLARGPYNISVNIFPSYNILKELCDPRHIQEKIVKPVIESIVSDIEAVEDLFEQLRRLTREGRIQDDFYYKRHPDGNEFGVYDYSLPSESKLFERLKIFRSIPELVFKERYQNFYRMADFVSKEGSDTAHVRGSSLREATERALTIYNWAEELRKI